MAFDDVIDNIADSDTLMNAGALTAGFVLSDTAVPSAVNTALSTANVDFNVPEWAYGLVTAAAFYAYGEKAMSQETANFVALGGLVSTIEGLVPDQVRQGLDFTPA